MTWMIALHGGATEVQPDEEQTYVSGCHRALDAGRTILTGGDSAVGAVVAAIRVLEADPTFNAGTESARSADGSIEMDAALMDGSTLGLGAVTVIRDVRHPISVALALIDEKTCMLAAGKPRPLPASGASVISPFRRFAPGRNDSTSTTTTCSAPWLSTWAATLPREPRPTDSIPPG